MTARYYLIVCGYKDYAPNYLLVNKESYKEIAALPDDARTEAIRKVAKRKTSQSFYSLKMLIRKMVEEKAIIEMELYTVIDDDGKNSSIYTLDALQVQKRKTYDDDD